MTLTLWAAVAAAQPGLKIPELVRATEAVHRRQAPQGAVFVRVRPARPWMGRHVTVLLDFGGEPLVDGSTELSLAVYRPPSAQPLAHVVLQPLSRKGLFGAHFTPELPGAYRVEVRERLEPATTGRALFDVPLSVEATQPDEEEHAAIASSAKGAGRDKVALDVTMEALGEHWDDLALLLKDPRARKDDAIARMQALAEVAANVPGQLPRQQAVSRKEFDGYAQTLQSRLAKLAGTLSDRPAARAEMEDIENTVCLRCHTKFRFNIAEDVKDWPRFEPREPKGAQEPKR